MSQFSHFGMGGDIFGYGTPPEGVCSLQMERERPDNGDAKRNAAYWKKKQEAADVQP